MMNEKHTPDLPEDEEDGINLLDILQTLAENARLLVFGPLIVGLIALGVSFNSKPIFVAETNIMIPQQQSGAAAALAQLGALAGAAGLGSGLKNPAGMYIGLLQSRTVADRMVTRFGMMKASSVKTREHARDILARISKVTARKDGLITIMVVAQDPKLAAAMANAYVEELTSLTDRLAVTEAQKRRKFLEKELAKAKKNLVRAEIALGSVGVSDNVLKFNPAAMGQGMATIKAQITARELRLSSMRGVLTENSPDFRQAQRELAALRGQLDKFENTEPTGGNAEYINRYRDFKYNEVLFEQLAKQFEMAKIDEAKDGAVIQVVDVAIPPERKSNTPKSKIASMAALAAGFVLLLFVFVRRALKNANQSPENAAKLAAIRAGFLRVLMPWRSRAKAGR